MLNFNESYLVARPSSLWVFLIKVNLHNIKRTTLKPAIQWHLVCSLCCVYSFIFSHNFSQLRNPQQVFVGIRHSYPFSKQNIHWANCYGSGTRLSSGVGYKMKSQLHALENFFFFFNPRERKPVLQASTTLAREYLWILLINFIEPHRVLSS